jgi:YihY family inner membrane protein
MNPVEKTIRRIDATQQRFRPTAFVFGVIKKYGDDNGGVLVSNLAYSVFISLFPLLLILVTVLGLIASHDPSFRESAVKNAVAKQIPLLGQALTSNIHALQRSSQIGLIVGLLVLIYGVTGLAQAGLFTMQQVWNLPGPARPGYVQRLGRSLLFLALLGGGVIVTTALASFGNYLRSRGFGFDILLYVVTAAFGTGMYLGAFRALTAKGVPTRSLLPGAVTGGILWTVLQVLSAWLVARFLHSNSVYGIFASVLGLLAWIYLATEITVYSAEINVVLARRLWPRSIVQPPLTEADRASLALQALQNQRRPEEHVEVTWDDRPPGAPEPITTPQTPDEVAPPAPVPDPRAEPDPNSASPASSANSARPANSEGDRAQRSG